MSKISEDRWDYHKTIQFIRLLHARPIIWKKNIKEFVPQSEREAAIAEIAERMNTSPARIKDKIKRMKEHCYQEEIRMQTFNDYMPRWNFFHQFRFILKADHPNECMQRECEQTAEPELNDVDEILWIDDVDKKETLYDETDILEQELQNSNTEQSDEFDLLGESVANELRRLEKHKELQTKIKNEITLAMLEAIENVAKQKCILRQ